MGTPESIIAILNNVLADQVGVERFTNAMLAKLEQKRAEGRYGWNREQGHPKGGCSIAFLRELLAEHLGKGDMVDVANIAMMIWNREHPTGEARK